jgi:hypothetical protein
MGSTPPVYGNLSISNLILYNNATDTSANLTLNPNTGDGNFNMSTGLDISGSLIFMPSLSNSIQQYFTGIPLNGNDSGTTINLTFPYTTVGSNLNSNALTPYSTSGSPGTTWLAPCGLGITWNLTGTGEVDLIGYGGSSSTSGGITIYGYNDDGGVGDNANRIADFWPTGSTLYSGLTLYNTTSSSSGTIEYNTNNDGNFYMNHGLDINGELNVSNSVGTYGIYSYSIPGTSLNNGTSNVYVSFTFNPGSYGSIYCAAVTVDSNSNTYNASSGALFATTINTNVVNAGGYVGTYDSNTVQVGITGCSGNSTTLGIIYINGAVYNSDNCEMNITIIGSMPASGPSISTTVPTPP